MNISKALYLIDVLSGLGIFLFFISVVLFIVMASLIGLWFHIKSEMFGDEEEKLKPIVKKIVVTVILFFVFSLGAIAIPTKGTMRNILIVKTVTNEATIESAKEVYEFIKQEIVEGYKQVTE